MARPRRGSPGRRFFVAIGAGRPGGSLRDLQGVPRDLVRMGRLFQARGYTTVRLGEDLDAFRLRAALCRWLMQAKLQPVDTVVIYFSGHGCVVDGDHYLCCRGFRKDAAATTGLKAQDLAELTLRRNPRPGKLWLILDCCAAGGVLNDAFYRVLAAANAQVFVLAATGSWSEAFDGSFSRAFQAAVGARGGARRVKIALDQLTEAINARRPGGRAVLATLSWSRFNLLDVSDR
jgi:hypothetical protein